MRSVILLPTSVLSKASVFSSSFPFMKACGVSARSHAKQTRVHFGHEASMIDKSQTFNDTTNLRSGHRPKIWIDTDVGFDDLVAIGCSKNWDEMAGISTVGGGMTCDPMDGFAILKGLFPDANDKSISTPIVPGRGKSSMSITDPSWLSKSREQMKTFCATEGIPLSSHIAESDGDIIKNDEASKALSKWLTVASGGSLVAKDNSIDACDRIDIICMGPLTNLAHWLETIPDFSNYLNSVWILGGNLPTRDALAEFNFARDPEATRSVLSHPALTIYIVPQEVCDRRAFEDSFRSKRAETIVGNWLESSPYPNTSVSSLMPPWMVRLIQTRSFSMYGDSICVYVRDNEYRKDTGFNDGRPRIQWKTYTTGNSSDSYLVLGVDCHGRLVLSDEANQPDDSKMIDSNDTKSATIRIAHKVELGPKYLDWMTKSLLSTWP